MRALQTNLPGLFIASSVLVFLVALFYIVEGIELAPYPGFVFGPDWIIEDIPPCEARHDWCVANRNTFQVGDQILAIGDLTAITFQRDRSRVSFDGYDPGDRVPLLIRRNGEEKLVHWVVLGPTNSEMLARASGLFTFFPLWLAGSFILLLLQTHDRRWWLLVFFNYFTALFLAIGSISYLRVAYSSLVLHAIAWLLLPIYLHLHLTIPSSLFPRLQRSALAPIYLLACVLATLELFQLLPSRAFYLALVVAIGGSLSLLSIRLLGNPSPSDRMALRMIWAGVLGALGPGTVLIIIPQLFGISTFSSLAPNLAVLSVPVLPFVYLYAIYKYQLGGLEFRATRLVGSYAFLLLYCTAFITIFLIGSKLLGENSQSSVFSLGLSITFVVLAPTLRARFETWLDLLAYGDKHDPAQMIGEFANRIAKALERESLARLLLDEILPSLRIMESALYLLDKEEITLLYTEGIRLDEDDRLHQKIRLFSAESGRYRPHKPETEVFDTTERVRLALELRIGKKILGLWLLGCRDPDDFYPQKDILLLRSIANQIAVALQNIRLFEETKARAKQMEMLRRELDEALRSTMQQKSRYAAVLHSISVAAVTTDSSHRIEAINPAAEALLQADEGSVIGRPWHELFVVNNEYADSAKPFWQFEAKARTGGHVPIVHARLPLRARPQVVLDINSSEVQVEGAPLGHVHILQDVSAQEDFARLKDEFMLNLAHELKGPLASWRAGLDLFAEDYASMNERQREVWLQSLQKNLNKYQSLLEQLMEIGKAQAGKFRIRPYYTKLNQLIRDTSSQLVLLLNRKGQTLDLNLDLPDSFEVLADRKLVAQVLTNLLSNASKYGPPDKPISVTTCTERGWVFIRVTDRGAGIRPEELAQLFTRFYRGKRAEEEGAGIGLGLALAKGVIEAHGGQIGVSSQVGEGSTFWFSLPEANSSGQRG